MKRKVNRVGKNTLTVSLPSKWAEKYGVKSGDEIEVIESGSSITLSTKEIHTKVKEVKLNIDGFDLLMLTRHLNEFYRRGVERIIVTFSKETILYHKYHKEISVSKKIKDLSERFVGLEIISQSSNQIVLESLMSKEEPEKLDVVLNRVYFLIKEFFHEFILAMDGDFKKFHEQSYDYHDNITKFSSYYLRLLNVSDLSEDKKVKLFGLFVMIDTVIDKVRHASEQVNKISKITPKLKKYLKEIYDLFLEQFDMLLKKKYSLEELSDFVRRRYLLVEKVNNEKFTESEYKAIGETKILLDTINEFTEAYLSLHMDKYLGDNK